MLRFPGTLKNRAFLFAAVLFAAVASPLAAQQDSVRTQVAAAAAPVSEPTSPLGGPRVRSEFRPAESSFSRRESFYRHDDTHTITVTTLVLVLAVVILVLVLVH